MDAHGCALTLTSLGSTLYYRIFRGAKWARLSRKRFPYQQASLPKSKPLRAMRTDQLAPRSRTHCARSCGREGLMNFASCGVAGRVAREPRGYGRNRALAASFAVKSSNKTHCGNIARSDLETTHGTAKSDHSAT